MTMEDQSPKGACPLLAAVLPLRYAIGPTAAIDTSAYDLPALDGVFPELGPRHLDLTAETMNYTSRLLRDGWLYVWESNPAKLVEYQVTSTQLTQTPRAGRVIDSRVKPHLILRAGDPAGLVWSPVRWSNPQYKACKTDPAVRQRIMRSFIPGAAPFSGAVQTIAEHIGEHQDPARYGWSSQAHIDHVLPWVKVLEQMAFCEQQSFAVIDDPWGVMLDLAALTRTRKDVFDDYRARYQEQWAIAGVLRSLAKNDRQLAEQLPSLTRYDELTGAWNHQDTQEQRYTDDIRRLVKLWAAWFQTLQATGPSSMDSACGHFDIAQPLARNELEVHFAAACLGPASTSLGANVITRSLEGDHSGKPWLLWALLGLPSRLGVGEIKYLVDFAEAAQDNTSALQESTSQLARAFGYASALNKAAEKLSQHNPASSIEGLFLALAPVAGAQLHHGDNTRSIAGHLYMAASLARSDQRIQTHGVTTRQLGEWYSDLIGTRNTLPAHLNVAPIANAVNESIPFMSLVPANTHLPALPANLLASAELRSVFDLKGAFEKAPLKVLVTLMAGVNFVWAGKVFIDNKTAKNLTGFAGSLVGVGAAGAAVWQRITEINWESIVRQSGKLSTASQLALIEALGSAAKASLAQSAFLAFDVVTYGVEALEAYQDGDFDTMMADLIISGASLASIVLQVQAFRALRAARAAVMAGQIAAISRGLNVLPHFATKAISLALLIVAAVVARQYTKDTPLEKWVKNTSFGIRPAVWANSYGLMMDNLYPVLYPVTFDAFRLSELSTFNGQVIITYLILQLPGENIELTDTMIYFKGKETWGTTFGLFSEQTRQVEWTGSNFHLHRGTRVQATPGHTTYRRVYHEENSLKLQRIEGELIYSPRDGLILPAVQIKELAWI